MEFTDETADQYSMECLLCGVHVRLDKARLFVVGHIRDHGPACVCPSCWGVMKREVHREDAREAEQAALAAEKAEREAVEALRKEDEAGAGAPPDGRTADGQ